MDSLYEKLAELLEVSKVSNDDVLREFEVWDSLTALTIIALCDSDYNITLASEDLSKYKTIGDLVNFINSNKVG